MAVEPQYFVGVDWGSQEHHVCVCDVRGAVIEERQVAHTGEALGAWMNTLLARADGEAARLAVALEVPRGAVVEALLGRGIPTFSLNPKQASRFRERETAAGAKDDRRDARVLARALRTDGPLFRPLAMEDPLVIQLRECTRMDAELMVELGRLTSRLREQWQRYYPQWLQLSPAADDAWVWRLWEKAPTPAAGGRVRRKTVEMILQTHRIRRWTTDEVLGILATPALPVAPGTSEAAMMHAGQLIARLDLVREQRAACQQQLEALLTQLAAPPDSPPNDASGPSDVTIVRSMPGVGPIVAARLLAEAGPLLAERAYTVVRAWAGVAPVTRQSGKTRQVTMRTACNRVLRDACFYWASASMRCDAMTRRYYKQLRARGHTHGRALRSVADRLLRILFAMLTTRTLYTERCATVE